MRFHHIHTYISGIIALTLIVPFGSLAIDRTTAGRILDNFKDKQQEILFESVPFTETGANDLLIHEYTMNWLEALGSRLDMIESGYKLKKALVSEKRFSLEEALRVLDISISQTEESLRANRDTIKFKSRYLENLHTKSIEMRRKIVWYRNVILDYIAAVYSQWNSVYAMDGNIDIMQTLILSEWSTDFIITDMTYKSLVTELWQKFVEWYRGSLKEHYVISLQIDEEITELQLLKDQLEAQSRLIVLQKNERQKLLDITKWQEKLFDDYLEAQKEAQESVTHAWIEAAQEYNNSMQASLKKYWCWDEKITEASAKSCHMVRSYFSNEKKLKKAIMPVWTPNIFTWPSTSREITTYFRDTGYYNLLGSQHDAIDIRMSQWTDVVSVAPWYAYYILPPVPGWYSYLAIKHPDGYVTVYGHLSEILINENQYVEWWQVIAKSGGLPWTPWAWPMTTGPHLHFEVWKDKNPVDPLRYLSLTQIKFEDLPSLYEDKFINDIVELWGDLTKIDAYNKKFVIKGKTEKARQEYLLTKYATPDFQDWNLWVDAGINARIDPSFLMCVGLAETTLWNHLKTPYNIGNIWNTDSWSTYSFSSSMEWIEWMGKTFNNKFLKKYTKLSELSRWGNEDGSIYASSGWNWHNNIVRCVSALKGKFIENDFEFRLSN
jgi:murein DD-endopeptidase MepM/ murein hydrolase activator NlpD